MYLIYWMHPVYSNLSESDSIYPFKFKLFYLFYLCDLFIFYSTLFYSVLFCFILFYCLLLYPVLFYSLLFPIYCRYLEPNNLFRIREISYKWCWTEWAACMSGDVPQIYSTGKMDQWNSDSECQPSDFSIAWPEAKNSCEIPKRVLRFGDDLTHWWPSNGLWHWLCHIPETIAGNHHFFFTNKKDMEQLSHSYRWVCSQRLMHSATWAACCSNGVCKTELWSTNTAADLSSIMSLKPYDTDTMIYNFFLSFVP